MIQLHYQYYSSALSLSIYLGVWLALVHQDRSQRRGPAPPDGLKCVIKSPSRLERVSIRRDTGRRRLIHRFKNGVTGPVSLRVLLLLLELVASTVARGHGSISIAGPGTSQNPPQWQLLRARPLCALPTQFLEATSQAITRTALTHPRVLLRSPTMDGRRKMWSRRSEKSASP